MGVKEIVLNTTERGVPCLRQSVVALFMVLPAVATPCFAVELDCGLDVPPAFRFLDTSKPDFGVPGATVQANEQKYRIALEAEGGPSVFYDQRIIQVLSIDRARGEFFYGELLRSNPSLQTHRVHKGICQPKAVPKF